jgi:hypothetical protein
MIAQRIRPSLHNGRDSIGGTLSKPAFSSCVFRFAMTNWYDLIRCSGLEGERV